MMALKVTPPSEEEGSEVEGIVRVVGLVVSIRGRFSQSWALLCRIEAALMEPITM